jgi:hypothetical protein
VGEVHVEGYTIIGRSDGRKCGGVAVFAQTQLADNMTLMLKSKMHERIWILVHSDLGPYLICAWYRLPVQGEVNSIKDLRQEWQELSKDAMGTIIIGDMNIHHKKWLRLSSRNTAEGDELYDFCVDFGMQQMVRGATRENHLLDLVLTDVDGVKCKVLPKIADHSIVNAYFHLPVPETVTRERSVWVYPTADWSAVRSGIGAIDWGK